MSRESNGNGEIAREAHFKSAMGSEHHSGGFLNLSIFLKIFQIDLFCHVATFGLNVTTLTEFRKIKPLSRCDVGSQRRDIGYPYFDHLLECRDVGFEHRDVGFIDSLACHDVGSKCRDVALSPF